MKFIPWLAATVYACPLLVEIYPDPAEVPDREGEFVEVRLDESFRADSLHFFLDGKRIAGVQYPVGKRLLLVHDSVICPSRLGLSCANFKESLPNSRQSVWRMESGSCVDSVVVPSAKSGRAFQRRAESEDWEFALPTPGFANLQLEHGVDDCAIAGVSVSLDQEPGEGRFVVEGFLEGCDSTALRLEALDLSSGKTFRDSLTQKRSFRFEFSMRGSVWLHISVPEDEYPLNNEIDTLLVVPGKSPLVISEVHHCPQEPVPEWVEIYNASRVAFPLSRLRLCGRGSALGEPLDSLFPLQAVLLTKDSAELRSQLGYDDVSIRQVSMGYLNNTAGSLSLCMDSFVVDSVSWIRSTVPCPDGFSPISLSSDDSPGFVRKEGSKVESPFELTLSSRVIRLRGAPLRAHIAGAGNVSISLVDSSNREVWRTNTDAGLSVWTEVPVQQFGSRGVNYVVARQGDFEKVVGIVLRP